MKKTITAIALLASSNALALPLPRDPDAPAPQPHKHCLKIEKDRDGGRSAFCDMTAQNEENNARLLKNGCAKDQVALTLIDHQINSCLPPGAAQL